MKELTSKQKLERIEMMLRREKDIIKTIEHRYYEVDEDDIDVQRLIKEGKIKYLFTEREGILKNGGTIKAI